MRSFVAWRTTRSEVSNHQGYPRPFLSAIRCQLRQLSNARSRSRASLLKRRGYSIELGGIDRVVLRASSCFNRDQACALELGKVARYGRLGDPEATDDLLGVELALEQQIEHTQARRIRKGAGGVEEVDVPPG